MFGLRYNNNNNNNNKESLDQVISSDKSMENALRACCKGIKIGKILIHKGDENCHQ
nr:uridine kinase [Tanacetum cinerariifolium]